MEAAARSSNRKMGHSTVFLLTCLPVRTGGLGIRDPALVLGPAFIASNVGFAGSQGELPETFRRELSDAWSIVCVFVSLR